MLVSFSFGNYKSFKDENQLSLVAELADEKFEYSIGTPLGYSVLKASAVYGANASGKSKLFDALAFGRTSILLLSCQQRVKGSRHSLRWYS